MIERILLTLVIAVIATFAPYWYGRLWGKIIGIDIKDEPLFVGWFLGFLFLILTFIAGGGIIVLIHWIIYGH